MTGSTMTELSASDYPLRRILVGLASTSDVEGKARYAIDLAKKNQASITLLAISDVHRLKSLGPVPIGAYHHAEQLREHRIEKSHQEGACAIATFEGIAREAGIDITVHQVDDDPVDALAAAWRYHDLTVLGLKGWFDYALLGDPKDALVKIIGAGIRPILAVPPVHREVKNVVIGYNGSMESARSMKQFVRFRLWKDATIHLTCVGEPRTGEPVAKVLDDATELCESHGYKVIPCALKGKISQVMDAHLAAEKADLMVLGGSYRKILTLKRFGPHVLHMVQTGKIPLFISH